MSLDCSCILSFFIQNNTKYLYLKFGSQKDQKLKKGILPSPDYNFVLFREIPNLEILLLVMLKEMTNSNQITVTCLLSGGTNTHFDFLMAVSASTPSEDQMAPPPVF